MEGTLVRKGMLVKSVSGKGFLVENNVVNELSLIWGLPLSLLGPLVALVALAVAFDRLFHSTFLKLGLEWLLIYIKPVQYIYL
jgi:hypothetical protein